MALRTRATKTRGQVTSGKGAKRTAILAVAPKAGLLRGGAGRREARGRLGCHHQPTPAGNWRLFPASRPKAADPEPAFGVRVVTGCGAGKKPLREASYDQSRLPSAPDPVLPNSRGRSLRHPLRLRLHRRRGRGRPDPGVTSRGMRRGGRAPRSAPA